MSGPHPNFDSDRPTHPWRQAARNSAIALVLIGLAGVGYLRRYDALNGVTAWWVWGLVAASVVAVCFGHSAMCLAIGSRWANRISKAFLVVVLLAIVIWLSRVLDGWKF